MPIPQEHRPPTASSVRWWSYLRFSTQTKEPWQGSGEHPNKGGRLFGGEAKELDVRGRARAVDMVMGRGRRWGGEVPRGQTGSI